MFVFSDQHISLYPTLSHYLYDIYHYTPPQDSYPHTKKNSPGFLRGFVGVASMKSNGVLKKTPGDYPWQRYYNDPPPADKYPLESASRLWKFSPETFCHD